MGRAHVERTGASSELIAVVGENFVAALPAGSDAAVVAALGDRASRSVSVEELVGLIPLRGDGAVDGFALVVAAGPSDGDGVTVSGVVRGAFVVDVYSVGGSRRFSDRGIRPWLLADFQAVTAVVIGRDGAPVPRPAEIGTGTAVGLGTVTATRLDWLPAESQHPPQQAADSSSTGSPAVPVAPPAVPPVGDTVLRPRRLPDPEHDHDTVIRPRELESAPDAGAQPGPASQPGQQRELEPRSEPESRPEPQPAPEPEWQPPAPSRYGLRIGNGELRELDAVYLIGRRPRLGRVPAVGERVHLVDVPSPGREVSATHLEVRQQGDAVVVTDQRSTNGTVVVPPHADRIRLRPGQSIVVAPGTMVHIGDGTIVTISALEDSRERSTDPPKMRRPTT
ncbi:FHA domain-containing protein [Leifsonia sp. Leaf264]|uniref:FHA domain-containing protein n=1 Tax=Leifsonia sp. Leaf264 TaxID=1736314 RepID=UPI0006F471B8|nr:FHA domain-containing protein [Leifsonia sp. Leaf264]KQO99554.1 hypothetical protein ASF30_06430 [Leifsonia sp. Leaf264]